VGRRGRRRVRRVGGSLGLACGGEGEGGREKKPTAVSVSFSF
jgi:hypothetical protein